MIKLAAAKRKTPADTSELDDADKMIIREVLEGLIIKYQARRWSRITNASQPGTAK